MTFVRKLEQRRRITFCQAGNACRFSSQRETILDLRAGERWVATLPLLDLGQRRPRGHADMTWAPRDPRGS